MALEDDPEKTDKATEATAAPDSVSAAKPTAPGSTPKTDSSPKPAAEKGSSSSVTAKPKPKPEPAPEKPPDDEDDKPDGPNPFFGAAQFFSFRGFLAAGSLFLLTLIVCLMAIDLVWALGVALLFSVSISAGHLVFYTSDRQPRERVYFVVIAVGAFFGGALVVDLQLTLPFFIELRELNAATNSLLEELEDDPRFDRIDVSTDNDKGFVAEISGTVRRQEDLQALRALVEVEGFRITRDKVTIVAKPDGVEAASSSG